MSLRTIHLCQKLLKYQKMLILKSSLKYSMSITNTQPMSLITLRRPQLQNYQGSQSLISLSPCQLSSTGRIKTPHREQLRRRRSSSTPILSTRLKIVSISARRNYSGPMSSNCLSCIKSFNSFMTWSSLGYILGT